MPLSHRRSFVDFTSPTRDGSFHQQPNYPAMPPSPQPNHDKHRLRSDYGQPPTSRLSHEVLRHDIPDPPSLGTNSDAAARRSRFNMLRLRNFSEPELAFRATRDGFGRNSSEVPPLPSASQLRMSTASPAHSSVNTTPVVDLQGSVQTVHKQRRMPFARSSNKQGSKSRGSMEIQPVDQRKSGISTWRKANGRSGDLIEDPPALLSSDANSRVLTPPERSYPHSANLKADSSRPSVSSQSDAGDYLRDNTVQTRAPSMFGMSKRSKNRGPLFPLPVRIPPPETREFHSSCQPEDRPSTTDTPATPRASTSAFSTHSLNTPDSDRTPNALPRRYTKASPIKREGSPSPLPSPRLPFGKGSPLTADTGKTLARGESQRSRDSSISSPLQPPMRLGPRDRASTASSFGRLSHDSPQPWTGSARNSTSTMGRSSLGGFLNLARFKQGSDPQSPRRGSPGTASKSNSFAMSREALAVPEREEGDTPGKYLERLLSTVSHSIIATILSKSADSFAQAVLRSYCRRFAFFGEPIDMSLRKFLLEAELPKETQQIDRVMQAFADRYHECNPGVFVDPDQAYLIAFSLMMLHTDAFNKSNKHKMTKQDYVRNTSGQGVNAEILACFYDNICYTPFVHFEEDYTTNGDKSMVSLSSTKKRKVKDMTSDGGKKSPGPIDPYNLLVEQKLEILRPSIKESIALDDPYSCIGNQGPLDPLYLQRAFTHTGTLQIISARSRPTAYSEGPMAMSAGMMAPPVSSWQHPQGQAGLIDINVTKVGTLWRKATKKKKARSPWQEWGAILTGAQLYLFKNVHWVKTLLHQFLGAQKHGKPRQPVTFKPPLQELRPDDILKLDDAVALIDNAYSRHKHAFVFVRPHGQEEVLLADNESELNDWLGLINYAAAFRAAGVRIRGMIGGAEESSKKNELERLESTHSANSQRRSSTEAERTIQHRRMDSHLHRQVMAARRQIMLGKISEAEKQLAECKGKLDDLLRNARHLQVLAPIAPKTREDIIYGAATADARLKWTRRDIWRKKCHRDIWANDVHQDWSPSAESTNHSHVSPTPQESAKKEKGRGLLKLKSSPGDVRSPPQSPRSSTTPTSPSARRSSLAVLPGIGEPGEPFLSEDIFRTPPQNATMLKANEPWHLPPLQLNVVRPGDFQHRESVDSSYASKVSPSVRQGTSMSNGSSVSSLGQQGPACEADLSPSYVHESPELGIDDRELYMLNPHPDTVALPASRGEDADAVVLSAESIIRTPEGKHKGGVRRSLQKTLRDAQHHTSVNKHRRGQPSESNMAPNAENAGGAGDVDSTPGLERAKGRFILHGKQASVVQFGTDWPSEHMKQRREKWRSTSMTSYSHVEDPPPNDTDPFQSSNAVTSMTLSAYDSPEQRGASTAHPSTTHGSRSFKEDASVAETYALAASPTAMSSSGEDEGREIGFSFLDSDSDIDNGMPGAQQERPPNSEDITKSGDDTDGIAAVFVNGSASSGPEWRANRQTVIGPTPTVRLINSNRNEKYDSKPSGNAGGLLRSPLDDHELRRLSAASPYRAVKTSY